MILMYHKIAPEVKSIWWVSPNAFHMQMCELEGMEVVRLDEYDPENPSHVVITFDGVYSNVCQFALPILKRFEYPFELFISGDSIGRTNEFDSVEPSTSFASIEELNLMVESGGRVQWHSKSHRRIVSAELSKEELLEELNIPDSLKASFSSEHFKWFAYPHGQFDDETKSIVSEKFIGGIACENGSKTDLFALPRITVKENTKLSSTKISCIVASYNYGRFLPDALDSVLRQTVRPDEMIIIDDGSNDETLEIAQDYAAMYPKLIKIVSNETNQGIVKTFNKAVRISTGDFILILGADNRLLSNYIEECARILRKKPDVGIAYTDFYLFGDRARVLFASWNPEFRGRELSQDYFEIKFPVFSESSLQLLKSGRNFIHGSSMFRREAFDEAGGYVEREGKPEDYDLFLRIIDKGWRAEKAGLTGLEYRQHSKDQINLRLGMANLASHYYRQKKRLESENARLLEKIDSQSFALERRIKNILRSAKRLLRKVLEKRGRQ